MADPVVHLTNGVPDSGTGNITTLGQVLLALQSLAGALFAKVTDGTNTAAVKAASTAAAATDPALVVALSPNNTALGAGATTAATIRTALASDSPGIIATGTAGSPSATVLTVQGAAGATPQPVMGNTVVQAASSTITRPADTTAYASGDLVANSVTAGSVAALQFTTLARVSGGSGCIVGAQIQKSSNVVTNAAFRLHLFNTIPTFTSAGDNSAISTVVVASAKGYLGYVDITAMVGFSDVAWGSGAPDNTRGSIPYVATAQIIYGILEVRGAYTPVSAEVFTISLDALQD